ncbi:MAG: molybdopterin molybdotransferase MoeA [Candidatus Limnocylindrales bacterium]
MSENLISVEAALARMLDGVEALPSEAVAVDEAAGHVLAVPLSTLVTLPPWDNSAMDGFAVRSADVEGATPDGPVTLRVVGEIAAGHAPTVSVATGEAARILTGAMLPEGADAVVPVEETDAPEGVADLPERVGIRAPANTGQHVRRAGSDFHAGELLLGAGRRVTPQSLALVVAGGHGVLTVHRRPRVVVLATGDELVAPGERLGPGQIHDSNSPGLAAQARATGADVRRLGVARDTLDAVEGALRDAIAWADVVVCSGGVSVGAHDVVRLAFERLGRVELWRVAVQPGKPLAFGRAAAPDGRHALLFGLPGNPVSSFVTFEIFVRPVLRALAGDREPTSRSIVRAHLAEAVTKGHGRRAFLRVSLRLDPGPPGGLIAALAGGQGSHQLSALAAADGLAVVAENVDGLPAGSEVEVWDLRPMEGA